MEDIAFHAGTYEISGADGTVTIHVPEDVNATDASNAVREMLKEVSSDEK